ncbi:MAG: hypothetical protein P4L84_29285 [Isosphaeraceae bacterium]|nr:hypothetical protein [Isosphaeraceae bacterium]
MLRHVGILAASLLMGSSLRASELDAEFGQKSLANATAGAVAESERSSTLVQVNSKEASSNRTSELDAETPVQAFHGGGGFGHGFGGGGFGHGFGGGGFGHGFGYGGYGFGRGFGYGGWGFGGGLGYGLGFGYGLGYGGFGYGLGYGGFGYPWFGYGGYGYGLGYGGYGYGLGYGGYGYAPVAYYAPYVSYGYRRWCW